MKLYIPFNMIIDTDVGIIRLTEMVNKLSEYPINKLKSFLIKRTEENPIPEYGAIRKENIADIYDLLIENHYNTILKLSEITDVLSFVINTHKLGLSNELEIIVGCDHESEIEFFKNITSKLKHKITTDLNMNIKLNDYDHIFTKYLNEYYVDYLLNNGVSGKRLYVADYGFNTILDEETNSVMIDPMLHLRLESEGNIVNTISLYNKK